MLPLLCRGGECSVSVAAPCACVVALCARARISMLLIFGVCVCGPAQGWALAEATAPATEQRSPGLGVSWRRRAQSVWARQAHTARRRAGPAVMHVQACRGLRCAADAPPPMHPSKL
jgi:hypothetical protein